MMNGERMDDQRNIKSLCDTVIATSVQLGEQYRLGSQDMCLVGLGE